MLGLLLYALVAGAVTTSAGSTSAAPIAASGLPFIHDFRPTEYGGAAQNWALAQDRAGVIYVGNVESGVLSFDGATWRIIPVPHHATVRSLALGADGRIYVGTVGDFGYLGTDDNGARRFVSLRDRLPVADRTFADVWSTHAAPGGIYFVTLDRIIRYDYATGATRVWKARTSFHLSFLVDGTLYIREVGTGILKMVGDQLQRMPGSERFAADRIYAMLPWHGPGAAPGDLLLAVRGQGWFIAHAGTFRPWATAADALIRQYDLYGAILLPDHQIGVATLRGGFLLMNDRGQLLGHLDHTNGLRSDMVLALSLDRDHGVWLATGNGVARVAVDTPLSVFDDRSGLRGEIQALRQHAGKLYAGTTEGLFELVDTNRGKFRQLATPGAQVWDFATVGDDLVVGGDAGIFALDGPDGDRPATVHTVSSASAVLALTPVPNAPGRIAVGYMDGFGTIRHTASGWIDEGRIGGITEQIRSVRRDHEGNLWLSPWMGGLIRLTPKPDDGTGKPAFAITRFSTADGLPSGMVQSAHVDGQLCFITDRGLYRFDAATRRFVPDTALAGLLPDSTLPIDSLYQDRHGAVWMTITDVRGIRHTGRAVRTQGHWRWIVTPLQRMAGAGANTYLDDGQAMWLGSDNGLFRYVLDTPPPVKPPATLLRLVAEQDGTALHGEFMQEAPALKVPYAHNALRFEFALPSYDAPDANRYQVRLVGMSDEWSPWSTDSYRDYTSLAPGSYRFEVRSRDVYGQLAAPARFAFHVLPPWYRTWWAWVLWIVLGGGLASVLWRWRSARLRLRNQALVNLVAARTAELAQANAALQQANTQLSRQALTDPLTGLRNRRYLKEHLAADLRATRRGNEHGELLFVMVDLDHFKHVNDTWGHAAGDLVLQQLRDILLSVTRDSDTPVRRGGEEFLIVARLAAMESGAPFAERLRAAVAAHAFAIGDGKVIHVTCSVGFACYPSFRNAPELLTWEQTINLADACLYAAKHAGRNAWAGLPPMQDAPDGDVLAALRTSLDRYPDPGPLRILTSWSRNRDAII